MNIGIASDHAGYDLKTFITNNFTEHHIVDYGTNDTSPVDYPDYAKMISGAITKKEIEYGILICSSGIGISIAANRNKNIRAALCHNRDIALLSRKHNDANIIVFGSKFISNNEAIISIKTFINTEFEAGRHLVRINKIDIG